MEAKPSSFFCLLSCSCTELFVMFAPTPLLLLPVLLFPEPDVCHLYWLCAVVFEGFITAVVRILISFDRCLMTPSLLVVEVSPSP